MRYTGAVASAAGRFLSPPNNSEMRRVQSNASSCAWSWQMGRATHLASVAALALATFFVAAVGCAGGGDYVGKRSLDDQFAAAPNTEPESPGPSNRPANSQPATPQPTTNSGNSAAEANGNPAEGNSPVNPSVQSVNAELTPEVEARVRALVADLMPVDETSTDAVARAKRAESQLVAMGMPIVPALERMSNAANALTLATVIAQIKVQHAPPPPIAGNENGNVDSSETIEPNGTANGTQAGNDSGTNVAGVPRPMTMGEMYEALLGQKFDEASIDERSISRFLLVKLREMETAAQQQEYARAIALGEAVLTLVPATQFARQINSRLDHFREMQTQRELLDGRIIAVNPEVQYGERLTFRVVLKNVSQRKLTVVFSQTEVHSRMRNEVFASPCVLRIKFTQWADARTPVESVRSEYLEAQGRVDLNPGEVWSMEWTLNTAETGEQLRAIGEFEVSGIIRPLAVESVEGSQNVRMINCAAATARVLPAAYNSAKADPIGELRASLARRDEVGIALAASAARNAAPNVRKRVVEILMDGLSNRGSNLRQAIFNGLAAVTGYKLSNEEHWRMWYEANKDKPNLGLGN